MSLRLAQIVLQVEKKGFEAFAELEEKLKNINKLSTSLNILPAQSLSKDVSEISKNVDNLGDFVEKTVKRVVSTSSNVITDQTTRVSQELGHTVEKALARTLPILAISAWGSWTKTGGDAFALLAKGAEGFSGVLSSGVIKTFDFFVAKAVSFYTSTATFINQGLVAMPLFAGMLATGGLTLFIIKSVLGEIKTLFFRILGKSPEALNPLQKIVSFFDIIQGSLTVTGTRIGQLIKTGSLIGLTFLAPINPILLGIASINSGLTSLFDALRVSRLKLLSRLGSPKAQIQLLFLTAREALEKLVPYFENIAEQTKKMVDSAGTATKELGKMKTSKIIDPQQAETLRSISRLKLPLAEQIQILFAEIKPFFRYVSANVNTIMSILARMSGISLPELDKIKEGSLQAIKAVENRGINAGKAIEFGFSGRVAKIKQSFVGIFSSLGQGLLASFKLVGSLFSKAKPTTTSKTEQLQKTELILKKVREDFQLTFSLIDKGFQNLGKGSQGRLNLFVNALSQLGKGKDTQKYFRGVTASLGEFFAKTKDMGVFGTAVKESFSALAQNADLSKTNIKNITEEFKKLEKVLESVKGKTVPTKLFNVFKDFELQKTYGKDIEKFFLSLLGTMKTSGEKIPKQLAQGVKSSTGIVKKPIEKLVEDEIAGFFPRSPARFEPLRSLVKMGAKIPMQLAQGVLSATKYVINVFEDLAKKIKEKLEEAVDIGILAEKTKTSVKTLSGLDFAFKGVKGSINDLSYVLTNINKIVNTTQDLEKIEAFNKLGIDLLKVRSSSNSNLELVLQISEVLRTYPENSKEATKALELIGLTPTSNLVVALKKGRAEIEGLIGEADKLGLVYDKSLTNMARSFTLNFSILERFKKFIFLDFLKPIVPVFNNILKDVNNLFATNREQIRSFAAYAGTFLANITQSIANFVKFAVKNPQAALALIVKVFLVTKELVLNILAALLAQFDGSLKIWAIKLLSYVSAVPKVIFGEVLRATKENIEQLLEELNLFFLRKLRELFKKNKALVDTLSTFFPEFKKAMSLLSPVLHSTDEEFKVFTDSRQKELDKLGFNGKRVIDDIFTEGGKTLKELEDATKKANFGKKIQDVSELSKKAFSSFSSDIKTAFANTPIFDNLQKFEGGSLVVKAKDIISKIKADAVTKIDEVNKKIENSIKEAGIKAKAATLKTLEAKAQDAKLLARVNPQDLDLKFNADQSGLKATQEKELQEFQARQNAELEAYRLKIAGMKNEDALYEQYKQELLGKEAMLRGAQAVELNALAKKAEKDKMAALTGSLGMYSSVTGKVADLFGDMYETLGKKNKEFFFMQKAAAVATATLNIAKGVLEAIGQGGIMGIATGALVAAAGGVQLAKIISARPGYAQGGMVQGDSNGKDTLLARLTKGEFVIPKDIVNKLGEREIRNRLSSFKPRGYSVANLQGYATGGVVGGSMSGFSASSSKESIAPVINNVNVIHPELLQQYMNTRDGQKTIINVLANNKQEFMSKVYG